MTNETLQRAKELEKEIESAKDNIKDFEQFVFSDLYIKCEFSIEKQFIKFDVTKILGIDYTGKLIATIHQDLADIIANLEKELAKL